MFSGFDANAAVGGFPIQPTRSINHPKTQNGDKLGLALGKIIDEAQLMDGEAAIKQQGAANGQLALGRSQVAGAALDNIQDIAGRLGELAGQAASGMMNDSDRAAMNAEAQQLNQQLQAIISDTTFNGQNVLQGASLELKISSSMTMNDPNGTGIATALAGIDLLTQAGAEAAIGTIADAQTMISNQQAVVGGSQNAIAHQMIRAENEAAAIKDMGSSTEMAGLLNVSIGLIQQSNGDAIASKIHSAMNQQKKNLIDMI
jgi:flagellin